jgi:hypothetical protein
MDVKRKIAQRLIRKMTGMAMSIDTDDYIQIYESIKRDKPDVNIFKQELENQFFEHQMSIIRENRNNLLNSTDKYIVADFPHPTEEAKQAWLDYRQALRDLPANTEDPENPIWPVPPN